VETRLKLTLALERTSCNFSIVVLTLKFTSAPRQPVNPAGDPVRRLLLRLANAAAISIPESKTARGVAVLAASGVFLWRAGWKRKYDGLRRTDRS
jgi:hypothetical protein